MNFGKLFMNSVHQNRFGDQVKLFIMYCLLRYGTVRYGTVRYGSGIDVVRYCTVLCVILLVVERRSSIH